MKKEKTKNKFRSDAESFANSDILKITLYICFKHTFIEVNGCSNCDTGDGLSHICTVIIQPYISWQFGLYKTCVLNSDFICCL